MRTEVDDRDHFNGPMMDRQRTWPRRKRSPQGGYVQQQPRHEYSRHTRPSDQEYPETYGTEFLSEEHVTNYPSPIINRHSMTRVRSNIARPIIRPAEPDYTAEEKVVDQASISSSFPYKRYCRSPSYHHRAEDVVLHYLPSSEPNFPLRRNRSYDNRSYDHAAEDVISDQPSPLLNFLQERTIRADSPPISSYHMSEEVVRGPPCSQSFPQRRRKVHFSPSRRSYSNYSRGCNNYYNEARRSENYKRKCQYHAKHREDTKERDFDRSQYSPKMKSRFSPKRAFRKPMNNAVKFSQSKVHIDKTPISKLESSADDPKGFASVPVSKFVNSARISETKCLKKYEVRSATRSLKSSKDDGESNLRKKHAITELNEDNAGAAKLSVGLALKLSKDDAEATCTKDIVTKVSNKTAEAYFPKKQAITKSSDENAEAAKLSKKHGDKSSKGDTGAKFPEKLVTKFPKDNVDANFTKNQATIKSSEENVTARLPKNLAKKSSKDDAKANFAQEIVAKLCEDDIEANLAKTLASVATTGCADNAEASLAKTLATTGSPYNAEANLAKTPATTISVDNVEVNIAKTLSVTVSADNAEANIAKTLATTFSSDNAEADVIQKASDVKTSKSNQKGAQCREQNDYIPHVSSLNRNYYGMRNSNVKCPPKNDYGMRNSNVKFPARKADAICYFTLMKRHRIICRTKCSNPPLELPSSWDVDMVKSSTVEGIYHLPQFILLPAFESPEQKSEWTKFLTFLHEFDRVGVVKFEKLKIHVLPTEPAQIDGGLYFQHAVVAYDLQELCDTSLDQRPLISARGGHIPTTVSSPPIEKPGPSNEVKASAQLHTNPPASLLKNDPGFESDAYVKGCSSVEKGTCSSKCHEAANSLHSSAKEDVLGQRNFVCAHPSYLRTLGQAHSSWIFGAIAELVDNSRDAGASRLDIAIETIHDKKSDVEIPMLSIIDDGVGMDHKEILRMISFGHKQPDEDNLDHIGRFGVGFKTGAMRLGKDALVLTQTTKSRSIAFLSQSLNEGKDNLEIPVVSFRRQAQRMEIDSDVQSEELAKYNLNALKEFSPFDEYLIGEKAGFFRGNSGTQIYIWNFDKWGSDYTLEWQAALRGGSSFHQGDIFIRSRRVRTRPGQTSRKVNLDYSLRSYLEVIFLEPRMKIYVQDSLVRSRPLAKSLNNTAVITEKVMSKEVQLTLGRCQIEWDEGNCGIFLYWHGRLIEAYKRVGGMIHNADMGRGVIGVIDVTPLMDDGNGGVWVHSNKQGFQDCEPFAYLEDWLGKKADEYWDKNFDSEQAIQLRKGNARYKPDNEWVQCDKCRKWRMLNAGFNSKILPKEWFCYMEPYNGTCQMPEQKPGDGVITVGLKRSCHDLSSAADCEETENTDNNDSLPAQGKCEDEFSFSQPDEDEVERHVLKRLRRGPPRNARKRLPLEVL